MIPRPGPPVPAARETPAVTGRRIRPAFTMAQLLILVAAMTLAVGLLIPTLKHQLGRARSVLCIENLHEVYHGLHMYRGDHDGWWPERQVPTQAGLIKDSNVWILLVAQSRYVEDLNRFVCPGDANAPRWNAMTHEFFRRRVCYAPSYGLNQLSWREHDVAPADDPGVKRKPLHPERTILLADLGPDVPESELPDDESRRRHFLERARDAGRLVADDGFRVGAVRPPGSWLTSRHDRAVNLMAMGGSIDKSHKVQPMMSRLPEKYYDDCAIGSCTFCNVFRAPHYDFSSSRLYFWTGPYDEPPRAAADTPGP